MNSDADDGAGAKPADALASSRLRCSSIKYIARVSLKAVAVSVMVDDPYCHAFGVRWSLCPKGFKTSAYIPSGENSWVFVELNDTQTLSV